ncbi:single-stranded DNA-binding protein [Paeniglutamicibacter antarcticus]|uniref:Single-stranded DNA-binding protein n=1 Tax=Arthrobacter terrae TaxID=2935737 RepID=A0A931CPL4_9MICC|nr:single-stranded DNA-binding protein [Arthrobacter terrae]MBG0738669.1 single-stranded DNA-binding protein [Arthrobacter terrae]
MGPTKGHTLYNIPFTGNLAHDLELNTNTASGIARLNFRLAVNEGERGSENEKTHFILFTAFGTTAENAAKSFKKGDRMIVLGRVNTYPKTVYLENAEKELEEKEISMVGFTASDISAPVRFATLDIHKVAKREGGETTAPAAAKKAPAPRVAATKPKVSVAATGGDDDF